MALPLEGIRIAEMGQLIAIPHATKLLGDMGAEVIRIESCARLDNYRMQSMFGNTSEGRFWDRAANFYEQNPNKMSLTLDLTDEGCLEALKQLISISDVFVENYTPRVMRNFKLEYDDLRKVRPDVIMVSSTGYGYTGPWSDFGAIGYTTEAASGLAHMTGYAGEAPALPEIPYADYSAAEHTAFAIMSALLYRSRTGLGQFIDVSQSETLTSTIPDAMMDYTVNGRIRERIGNGDQTMAPHGCYPCEGKDKWIAIAVYEDAQWDALVEVLGSPLWAAEARFGDGLVRWQNRDELDRLLGEVTKGREQYALMTALQEKGVPAGAVLNGKQLLFDPHLMARGFYESVSHEPSTGMSPLPYTSRPWKFSETPARARTAAPTLGQHNRHVLSEVLGLPMSEVDRMESEGAIGTGPVNTRRPQMLSLDDQKRQGRILMYEDDFREQLEHRDG